MAGDIQKRGKSWTTIVDLPPDPATGKRRQRRITARTKHEVEVERAKLLASAATGGFAEAEVKKQTLADYLNRWLKAAEQTLRPASYGRYQEIVKLHIVPSLGNVQLAKLSPLDVQRFYGQRLEDGLSRTTVNNIHMMLHKALDQAVRWNLIARNVTDAIDPPRRVKPEHTTWSSEQVKVFLVVADAGSLGALWRLAIFTGMRRGEILGLKWDDIDFERATLSVRRTYSRGAGGKYELGQTKTASARRQISLSASVLASLRQHRKQQVEARLQLGLGYKDEGFVFADALGEPIHPNTLADHFHRLVAAAKLPSIRIHDLRHTSATLMLENGEHPKVVSERLGHSNISMTLDLYSHVTPTMQKQAAERLENLIEGA